MALVEVIHLVVSSLAIACFSVTVSTTSLFKWARETRFVGPLFSCYYCLCHWGAACVVFGGFHPWGYTVTWLALTGLSAIWAHSILGD